MTNWRVWILFFGTLTGAATVYADAPVCRDLFASKSSDVIVASGDELRERFSRMVAQAKSSVAIQVATITDESFLNLLRSKAREGIAVRVLLDGRHLVKGPRERAQALEVQESLRRSGIDVRYSNPETESQTRRFPKAFLHRKLILVDDSRYYVGSSNIGEYPQNIEVGLFRSGYSVSESRAVFESDWRRASDSIESEPISIFSAADSDQSARLVGPGTSRPDIRAELVKRIKAAKGRILISAYEANDPEIIGSILRKRKESQEIDIRILLCQAKTNVWVGPRRYQLPKSGEFAEKMRAAGVDVRVFAPPGARNHSRFAVIDGEAYLGSADFTRRSFDGNVELGILLADPGDTASLAGGFEGLWAASEANVRSSMRDRLIERTYYFMETLTIGLYRLGILVDGR